MSHQCHFNVESCIDCLLVTFFLAGPEWTPVTEVDAYVVTIPHAAEADDAGLVNPLLKRFMDGVCGIKVFAFPATKVLKLPECGVVVYFLFTNAPVYQ